MSVRTRQILAIAVIALALLWPVAGDRIMALMTPDETGCAHSSDLPDADNADEARAAVLCLLNQHRADAGLPALTEDASLEEAAEAHAKDMGRRDFFAHRNPDGINADRRIRRAGFDGRTTGENIAWGTGLEGSPARIVDGWMESPGHRENILRPAFTRVGTGVGYDPPERVEAGDAAVYVNNFGG